MTSLRRLHVNKPLLTCTTVKRFFLLNMLSVSLRGTSHHHLVQTFFESSIKQPWKHLFPWITSRNFNFIHTANVNCYALFSILTWAWLWLCDKLMPGPPAKPPGIPMPPPPIFRLKLFAFALLLLPPPPDTINTLRKSRWNHFNIIYRKAHRTLQNLH